MSRKLRILITSGIFPPDPGGPASYVPAVGHELQRRGHILKVVTLADDPIKAEHDSYPFPVVRIKRSWFKPLRSLMIIFSIYFRARWADVVFVNGLSFEAMIATRLARRPSVHKIVGDYAWERARNLGMFRGSIDEYQVAEKSFGLRCFDWIRTTPLNFAAAVLVPSRYLAGIVRTWGIPNENIHTVYNAVEPLDTLSTLQLPSFSGHTIATVCRLVSWKGVDGLIRSLRTLKTLRLVVVGDGPMRQELESLAKACGVSDRVVFTGNVSRSDVAAILRSTFLFVLNSTYEGLPHVALEAMQLGIPVVAASAGGTPEVVRNGVTGLLVQPGDDAALTAAISKMIDDKGIRETCISGASHMLQSEFSSAAMFDGVESLLEANALHRNN